MWHDWVNVDATAYSNSVTLPLKGAKLLSQVEDVSNVAFSTTDLANLGVALDLRPEVEVSDIVLEILDINLWGHEVRSIFGKTEIGEGSQILGRYQLGIFVDTIGESATNLGFGFKEADLDRGNRVILVGLREELESGQASWATADHSNLHDVVDSC
jgi:hypothetical protein